MITSNENFKIHEKRKSLAVSILNTLPKHLANGFIISICGESGCGKSVTSLALYNYLRSLNKRVITLHMDNYFHLAPSKNHNQRILNIKNVGKNEVDLKLLQEHVFCFKKRLKSKIPILDKNKETFHSKEIDFSEFEILLIEGTYVNQLSDIDTKVFMDIDYTKTRTNRVRRGRDTINSFSEKLLQIEHEMVKVFAENADIVIDEDYNVLSR